MAIVVLALTLLVLVLALLVWLGWTAGRLDRMHLRCEGTRAALEAALAERAALTLEVSGGGAIDPASALLLVDAVARRTDAGDERWQRESDLSAVLRAVAAHRPDCDVWDKLLTTCQRVSIARRIHNDVVAVTLALRGRLRVRWFALAGHAEAPAMVAFDDEPPPTDGPN